MNSTAIGWLSAWLKALQWEIACRALALGVDVVRDRGFWARSARDDFRAHGAGWDAVRADFYGIRLFSCASWRTVAMHGAGCPGRQ